MKINSINTIKWSGMEWYTQERWGYNTFEPYNEELGQIHHEFPYIWYDKTAVKVDENDTLHLLTHKNPKYFKHLNVTAQAGGGLLSSTTPVFYGHYECVCKLPKTQFNWCAFWLYAWDSWPPEIDIFEAWTGKCGNYFTTGNDAPFRLWKVTPNFHIGKNVENHVGLNPPGKFYSWKNPANNFIKYEMIWTEDKIQIIYNNHLITELTGEHMKEFRVPFRMEFGNNLSPKVNLNKNYDSDFVIKYFKYTPL